MMMAWLEMERGRVVTREALTVKSVQGPTPPPTGNASR